MFQNQLIRSRMQNKTLAEIDPLQKFRPNLLLFLSKSKELENVQAMSKYLPIQIFQSLMNLQRNQNKMLESNLFEEIFLDFLAISDLMKDGRDKVEKILADDCKSMSETVKDAKLFASSLKQFRSNENSNLESIVYQIQPILEKRKEVDVKSLIENIRKDFQTLNSAIEVLDPIKHILELLSIFANTSFRIFTKFEQHSNLETFEQEIQKIVNELDAKINNTNPKDLNLEIELKEVESNLNELGWDSTMKQLFQEILKLNEMRKQS